MPRALNALTAAVAVLLGAPLLIFIGVVLLGWIGHIAHLGGYGDAIGWFLVFAAAVLGPLLMILFIGAVAGAFIFGWARSSRPRP